MPSSRSFVAYILFALVAFRLFAVWLEPASAVEDLGFPGKPQKGVVRLATFNASMSRRQAGDLQREIARPMSQQLRNVASIIQIVRPDILLINELDYDRHGQNAREFHNRYLRVATEDTSPLNYPSIFSTEVNTGLPTGLDLDGDAKSDGPADAYGFGYFPGQYGMAVYSRFPLDRQRIRTFQKFLWQDMPAANLPRHPESGEHYYGQVARQKLRLSSKGHWDVPIQIGDRIIHFLVCHPTPPVFDGPEDRNGGRNHDEIRFWADYITPTRAGYIYDDLGRRGGLSEEALFVIAGDLNADPSDGDSRRNAVKQLLLHPRVRPDHAPASEGADESSRIQGGANQSHLGNPANDTSDFSDQRTGNLRIDYVLPSNDLQVVRAGVFWPSAEQPGHDLIDCSDHRLVWIDIAVD